MLKPWLISLVAVSALGGRANAQSVAGNWDAAMNTPGGVVPFGVILQLKGDTLTGTVKRPVGDVPLLGNIKGDSVIFAYTVSYNDHPLLLTVTAKMVRDSLVGMVDFDGQGQGEFWARHLVSVAKPAPAPSAPGGPAGADLLRPRA